MSSGELCPQVFILSETGMANSISFSLASGGKLTRRNGGGGGRQRLSPDGKPLTRELPVISLEICTELRGRGCVVSSTLGWFPG